MFNLKRAPWIVSPSRALAPLRAFTIRPLLPSITLKH